MRLIKIDDVIKKLNDAERRMAMRGYYRISLEIRSICSAIKRLPTIDAVPVVRGEWKKGIDFSSYPRVPFLPSAYYCSNCEGEAYWDTDYGQQLFGFCPNCGAKMDKEG
jgi:hypothetical protein